MTTSIYSHVAYLASLLLLAPVVDAVDTANSYMNVYGNSLQSCSQEGMALTGYTRSGYCVDLNDDTGSHHVCIDLSSVNDNGAGNFCDVTGQSDWCSSDMPCHEDQDDYCQVQYWCVCQWAFASYLENAGGCDQIQDIVCESLNIQALYGYWGHQGTARNMNALDCIVERCGVENTLYMNQKVAAESRKEFWAFTMIGVLGIVAAVAFWMRNRAKRNVDPSFREDLVNSSTPLS